MSFIGSATPALPTTDGKFLSPIPTPPPHERNGPPRMWIARLLLSTLSEERGMSAVRGSQVLSFRSVDPGSGSVVNVLMKVELSVYEYIPRACTSSCGPNPWASSSNVQRGGS